MRDPGDKLPETQGGEMSYRSLTCAAGLAKSPYVFHGGVNGLEISASIDSMQDQKGSGLGFERSPQEGKRGDDCFESGIYLPAGKSRDI